MLNVEKRNRLSFILYEPYMNWGFILCFLFSIWFPFPSKVILFQLFLLCNTLLCVACGLEQGDHYCKNSFFATNLYIETISKRYQIYIYHFGRKLTKEKKKRKKSFILVRAFCFFNHEELNAQNVTRMQNALTHFFFLIVKNLFSGLFAVWFSYLNSLMNPNS